MASQELLAVGGDWRRNFKYLANSTEESKISSKYRLSSLFYSIGCKCFEVCKHCNIPIMFWLLRYHFLWSANMASAWSGLKGKNGKVKILSMLSTCRVVLVWALFPEDVMSTVPGGSTEQWKLLGKLKGKIVNIKPSLFYRSKFEDKKADHICFCACHVHISARIGTKSII